MTATLGDVTPRKKRPEPSAEEQAAAELVRLAREQGLSLTGPDGLLKQMTTRASLTGSEIESHRLVPVPAPAVHRALPCRTCRFPARRPAARWAPGRSAPA